MLFYDLFCQFARQSRWLQKIMDGKIAGHSENAEAVKNMDGIKSTPKNVVKNQDLIPYPAKILLKMDGMVDTSKLKERNIAQILRMVL